MFIRRTRKVFSLDEERSVRHVVHSGNDVDQSGFTTAGLAQNHEELSFVDIQVDPLEYARNPFAAGEFLDDIACADEDFFLFPCVDLQPFLVDGQSTDRGDTRAELDFFFAERGRFFLVDKLQAAENLSEVAQRNADHIFDFISEVLQNGTCKTLIREHS